MNLLQRLNVHHQRVRGQIVKDLRQPERRSSARNPHRRRRHDHRLTFTRRNTVLVVQNLPLERFILHQLADERIDCVHIRTLALLAEQNCERKGSQCHRRMAHR
uniref:(northern house mosquito) hypothetical protein n=1 Tax=Culex pipiens TaxID=7175 RepID=A0A8D8C0W8_CULPI